MEARLADELDEEHVTTCRFTHAVDHDSASTHKQECIVSDSVALSCGSSIAAMSPNITALGLTWTTQVRAGPRLRIEREITLACYIVNSTGSIILVGAGNSVG